MAKLHSVPSGKAGGPSLIELADEADRLRRNCALVQWIEAARVDLEQLSFARRNHEPLDAIMIERGLTTGAEFDAVVAGGLTSLLRDMEIASHRMFEALTSHAQGRGHSEGGHG